MFESALTGCAIFPSSYLGSRAGAGLVRAAWRCRRFVGPLTGGVAFVTSARRRNGRLGEAMERLDFGLAGDVISVCGLLMIFFSWITTNLLGERLKAAKAAYEEGKRNRRLFGTLNQLGQSVEDVAAQTVELERSLLGLASEVASRSGWSDLAEGAKARTLVLEIGSMRLSARQIDWGARFCATALEEANALAQSSPALLKLRETEAAIVELRDRKQALLAEVDGLYSGGQLRAPPGWHRLNEKRAVLAAIIAPFGPLLHAAVEASNQRSEELRSAMDGARRRVKLATSVALILYLLGTVATIGGSALDKVQRRAAASGLSAASSHTR